MLAVCRGINMVSESIVNKKEPYISIAIASYNYSKYLRRGIEAIDRQTYRDFEVVYLDDASKDNSVEVIKDIMREYPGLNIRLLQNEKNMGILYSKTRLTRECAGKYIMLCDADDWMADDCLAKLAKAAQKTKADRIVSEVANIDSDGKIIQTQHIPQQASAWLWNIHHGCLYRRSIITDNNIVMDYEPDDVCLITKFNMYCDKTEWVRETLYYWYVHTDSSGRATGTLEITDMTDKFKVMIDNIRQTYEALEQTAPQKVQDGALAVLAMKLYYLQLYHSMRYFNIGQKLEGYRRLHKVMLEGFPGYIKTGYAAMSSKNIRGYAYHIIKVSRVIERLHLMGPALIGYHLVGKFVYIDQ